MLALSLEGFRPHPRFPPPPLPSNSSASLPLLIYEFSASLSVKTLLAPAAAALCKSPHQYHSMGLAFPLFSYSYALFCHRQDAKPFIFKSFRTLWQKHPGWGGGLLVKYKSHDRRFRACRKGFVSRATIGSEGSLFAPDEDSCPEEFRGDPRFRPCRKGSHRSA